MPPLNPFLRAFFRSNLPGQCSPSHYFVLLVPTTESLFNSRERESGTAYVDLVFSEEFLGSHVLQVSSSAGSALKDVPGPRDKQGKTKQIPTVNGRTVVLRDASIYTNKGFKTLNQVQLLNDFLYYHPNNDAEPWLIYYISKPLLGSYDPGTIPQAVVPGYTERILEPSSRIPRREDRSSSSSTEIRSFDILLARFPMIARQMQAGLERVFREFGKELGKPLPPPPSPSPSASAFAENEHPEEAYRASGPFSIHEDGGFTRLPFGASYMEADEDIMRRALETAVTAAIDLFRQVDKQQLMLLGATTDLTGPLVERLIERYVAEQVHDNLLFPRLRAYHEVEDSELDVRIRQMESIDVSQVGIAIEGGRKGKEELIIRLAKGVQEFSRMIDARSPHAMLDVLLSTVKTIAVPIAPLNNGESAEEKEESAMSTINADILVSLLLVVVIRSQVRHLRARLLYMQQFIFIDDVESGEAGYALSTLEAVLTYLREDAAGLRRASARNKRLWRATKAGKVSDMKAILEPDEDSASERSAERDEKELSALEQESNGESSSGTQINGSVVGPDEPDFDEIPERPQTPRLTHVFPFHNWANGRPDSSPELPVPPRKKVSMDVRSLSELSSMSFLSHSTTGTSIASGIEGDMSIENLTKTQDPAGDSVPMMAIEAHKADALKYLLSLQEYYPIQSVLEDTNSNGTTLLSAAVQLGDPKIVEILLRFIFDHAPNTEEVLRYFSKADSRGRTVAHYVFSVPSLIVQLGSSLPWTQKDKLGQTPLFALCRSYDHPEYNWMVNQALSAAQEAQRDGQPLRVDDHVDARGNTLLHIVSDPQILYRILRESDCDPNATNDKRFTPLMTASKYGRVDLVRLFFSDPRVDVHLREARGFTAVELAKDEEVRNRIDDFVLFSNPAISSPNESSNRVTTVVRSLCIDENTVRFILKSGAPNPPDPSDPDGNKYMTYMVTTCRRSMEDFENLVKCLKLEHPASYLPKVPFLRSPYQMYSRPSRAVVHAVQERLDKLLKTLLAHPTFATHELLWEFFLVPEMQPAMIEERSNRKAAVLKEYILDDYDPVNADDTRDIEQLMTHALDAVRAMGHATSKVIRRGYTYHHATADLAEAISICAGGASSLGTPTNALPQAYIDAFNRYASSYAATSPDSSPLIQFLSAITSTHATTTAMETALMRPRHRINDLQSQTRQLGRLHSTVASSSLPRKFTFPGMEESRLRNLREQEEKIGELTNEINWLGKEIRWNKDVVLGELAGWTAWREKVGRDAIRDFTRTSLVRERERGKRLERCLRSVREMKNAPHGF